MKIQATFDITTVNGHTAHYEEEFHSEEMVDVALKALKNHFGPGKYVTCVRKSF